MKFFHFVHSWRGWLPVILIIFSFADSSGQVAGLKSVLQGQAANQKPETPEKPEEIRARLEQWLQEARDSLARLESATPPEGISVGEVENRRRDLEQMAMIGNRAIKSLSVVSEAKKDLENSRAEQTAWTGFQEKPPYSLRMVDDLLNERDALKTNLSSQESSLANYKNLLTSLVSEIKEAENTVNSQTLEVKNANEKNLEIAKWRLEAGREKSLLLAVRAALIKGGGDELKERIEATRIDLSLIERKVVIASKQSQLKDEDLEKIQKISVERKAGLRKELENLSKRLKAAGVARNQAQAALTEAEAAPVEAGKTQSALEMAKYRLEVAESRLDAAQSIHDGLESLDQLESINAQIYQYRREVIQAKSITDRVKKLEPLKVTYDRLMAWDNVVSNEISATSADLSKLESRAASINADDARYSLINDHRASKSEKLIMSQRVLKFVTAQRKLVKRWIEEYTPKDEEKPWGYRFADAGNTAWETLKKIWSFKLTSFEDSTMVAGEKVRGDDVPLTLGMLLRALLFFIVGYKILSYLARRIQGHVVRRGVIGDAQAKTLRNWAMIVVGIFLFIGTLAFLKIPLTVFAFFGGALAIGLGFGMQTLIKNFICGIILLVERKVRVGDMLEVDGFIGKVTEINTRSSVIRSADDMETMVPNSLFLENRVTNWTLTSGKVRRTLHVGVAYGTPPQKVMEVLTEAAARHGLVSKDPAPFAIFEDFGESSLVFRLYFWLDFRGVANGIIVASDLRLMIEKRFAELEIGVPFPQRDLHLNSDQPLKVHLTKDPDSL